MKLQELSPNFLVPFSDNLQSHSSCHPSLAKIFVFNSEDRDIVQPPPSPCEEDALDLDVPPSLCRENELEHKTNDREIKSENNENTVRETVKDAEDETFITASIEENIEHKKEELSSIENKEAVSSCNNCLVNGGCDDGDDCYKTQTFSTADLSKFWIPCTKNGETSLGNTENAMEMSNIEINNPSLKENKNKEQESTRVTNTIDKETVGTAIVDERTNDETRKNSVSFYVDFVDFKNRDSVNRTCKCGNILEDRKLKSCEECTNRLPEKKTFWISLDGETSDGETEGVSGTKKCVERKGSSSEEGERFSRRAQSLPENKLPPKPKFTSECIDLDVESHKQALQEKYLIVSSKEDTLVIQPKSLVDSRNEFPEDVAKDAKELQENSELKFYSEDTFVIEKNAQENGGEAETITQDTSEGDQGLTGNKVDKCNDGARELDKDSKGDKGVVGGEHDEVRSSIVLQSLSVDDDQQSNEEKDENVRTESTNCSEEESKLQTEPKKVVEAFRNEVPVFLKTAWSNDGPSVEQPLGVQICNAFPSPVPPVNLKPEVQPPIGNNLGKTKSRKTNSGKSKKKASAKESKKKDDKSSFGKEQVSSCGKKGKKGKKGKGKQTKPMFKEISVNQSFGCTSYDVGASSVACDLKEGMLSPDLDKVPTLSIDSRDTNKVLRRRFSNLSPIPESPRSTVSVTPRCGEERGSGEKDAVATLEPPERAPGNEVLVNQEERLTEMVEDQKVVTGDGEDHVGDYCIVSDNEQDEQTEVFDEGVDEVDGGMLSRLFNMCMPRLNMGSHESDSEALVSEADNNDNDGGIIDQTYQKEPLACPVDEADQDMEDVIQDILENHDHIKKDTHENAQIEHEDDLSAHNQSLSKQDNTGSSQETSVLSSDSTSSSSTYHHHGKQRHEQKNLKENWTTSYVRQMSDFSPWEFEATDDVFIHNENDEDGRVSMALNEEIMSDDSSYVSCESTSYPVSESSTADSNDSYISSQESFHGMSLSSRDDTTPGSVDIILHEQIHKFPTSITSSSGSSNNSRSTIRPRSNSNSSESSIRSFFPSASRGFVRSQVSSGSGSLSSTTSCGEELQWQKGSILGKGGFGTVSVYT